MSSVHQVFLAVIRRFLKANFKKSIVLSYDILTKRYRCVWRKAGRIYTVSVHKEVFSYEGSVATSVMEAAAFSLSAVDHGLDDSAIASISFMLSALPLRPSASTARICRSKWSSPACLLYVVALFATILSFWGRFPPPLRKYC